MSQIHNIHNTPEHTRPGYLRDHAIPIQVEAVLKKNPRHLRFCWVCGKKLDTQYRYCNDACRRETKPYKEARQRYDTSPEGKASHAAANKRWHAKNPNYSREYFLANRDKINARRRKARKEGRYK